MSHVNLQLERYTHILLHGHIAGSPPQGRPMQEKVDWQYQGGLFFSGDYTHRCYKICAGQKSVEDPSTQLGLPARGDPVFIAN